MIGCVGVVLVNETSDKNHLVTQLSDSRQVELQCAFPRALCNALVCTTLPGRFAMNAPRDISTFQNAHVRKKILDSFLLDFDLILLGCLELDLTFSLTCSLRVQYWSWSSGRYL